MSDELPSNILDKNGFLHSFTSVRAINRARVISLIRRNPGVMRADISRLAGLSKGTVSSLVEEMVACGFLYEDSANGARQRRLGLHLNRNAGAAVGIEIRPGECRGLATDMGMGELGQCVRPLAGTTVTSTVDALATVYAELMAGVRLPCCGVVVSVPGPTDPAGQRLILSPNLGWTDVPLGPMLSERLGVPASVINTPWAMTLGEYWYGGGVGRQHMIHVNVSSGIGAGIIVGGQMLTGARGYSSEIGHTTILPDGPLCACGNRGCLEALASLPAIVTQARARAAADPPDGRAWRHGDVNDTATYNHIIQAARDGDPEVGVVFRQAGQYLGIAVANLIDLFNPSLVLIGGPLADAGELVIGTVRETARRRSLSTSYIGVEIARASLGASAGCMGACSLVIDRYVAEIEPAVRTQFY